jgi:flagellar biosynthesis protein FlhB
MSDQPQDSKTFDPTPQRISQFREEGKVAVSKDVTSTMSLATSLFGFAVLGPPLFDGMRVATASTLSTAGMSSEAGFWDAFTKQLAVVAPPAVGVALLIAVTLIATTLWQTNFLIATKSLGFKPERLNPINKLKELLNPKKAAVTVLLSVGKMGLACLVMYAILAGAIEGVAGLALGTRAYMYVFLEDLMLSMLWSAVLIFAVLSVIDYVWQRHQIKKQMMMTHEEWKRDMEEQEGKPEYKGRRRNMHRDLTMNRIIQNVPEADVVVINPIHLAVVIRYKPGKDASPIVTAKGADSLAAYIRSIAREHGIPIVENKPLARVLWKRVKVGRTIPKSLFEAVAEVLARVFRARAERSARR